MNPESMSGPPVRFGAGFDDRTTRLRFEVHHPQERPDLWSKYLDGAESRYRKHGLAPIFDRQALETGAGVSLFWVGFDESGRLVAGTRFHGPLDSAASSGALEEMATSSEIADLRRYVERFIPYGVVEMKGGWGIRKGVGLHDLPRTFARCLAQTFTILGSELALISLSDRLQGSAAKNGGRMLGTEGAPYPSKRFRTILMVFRRTRVASLSETEDARLVRAEAIDLAAGELPENGAWLPPGPDAPGPSGAAWRPIVLDRSTRAQRQFIASFSQDPGIVVHDALDEQRANLRELRPAPSDDLLGESDRFVYYSWRQAMVRVLGPVGFDALRLDRNRHKITRGEQARLRQLRIGIVGLSVGHVVAHLLAMEGLCGSLRLADFDQLAVSNLNRIPASVLDIGTNKAVVTARRVAEIDPYLKVEIFPEGATAENMERFVDGLDLLIDECDSLDIKVLAREVARRHGVPVLMETSDRGLFDVERFDLEPERPLFHGLLGEVSSATLAGLSPQEKLPFVLQIVEAKHASARGAASLTELGLTLSTWPQLGGDVTLGAATIAAAVRRFGLGEPLPSGRVRVDLDAAVASVEQPTREAPLPDAGPDVAERSAVGDPIEAIASAASRAPSGGNAQPWRFESLGADFRVFLDPARTTTMDRQFRGSYVAIGAALFNARVAAAAQGLLGPVDVDENGPSSGPVAVLHLGAERNRDLASYYPGVMARAANRHHGDPAPIHALVCSILENGVTLEGARLHLLSDRALLDACSDLLAESDRLRFLSPTLHREMIGELRWPGRDSIETGIDIRTLELGPMDLASLAIARRPEVMAHLADWNAGQMLGMGTRTAVRSSSALAIVTVAGLGPADYVHGGAAVERLWLDAERSGLAVQPVSPVFMYATEESDFVDLVGDRAGELRALSERFRQTAGIEEGEQLALVLRLSHAPPPSARSLRLPLEQVLVRSPAPANGADPKRHPSVGFLGR
jgi:molybdopterin/thiamine biosynthesis adenylyltransferase